MSANALKPFLFWGILVCLLTFVYIVPISSPGILVGGDWVFPYTHDQLGSQFLNISSSWHLREMPIGTPLPHHNLYPYELLSGVFYCMGIEGEIFQKCFIALTIFLGSVVAYHFFYHITRCGTSALMGAIAYLLSPLWFNYFSIGWIFVLFVSAVLPGVFLLFERYLVSGDLRIALSAGLITSVGFIQSQIILWVPIVGICVAASHWALNQELRKTILVRTISMIVIIMGEVLLLHFFWIIPSLNIDESFQVLSEVSTYDNARFNSLEAHNLIRGWGAVFNNYYETTFSNFLVVFSFFPLLALIFVACKKISRSVYVFAAVLTVIVPFVIFLAAPVLLQLPGANIFRDLNRFIVIPNIGFGIGVALFFSYLKNRAHKVLAFCALILCIHPFISNSLFQWDPGQEMTSAPRLLDIPRHETEGRQKVFAGDKNLLVPTGAHISTLTDARFKNAYAEMADLDATFSPYAGGLYVSDKSSFPVKYFVDNLLTAALYDERNLHVIARLFGIDRLLIRDGLTTSLDRKYNSQIFKNLKCAEPLGKSSSDWSISHVCEFKESYPLFYSPETIVDTNGLDLNAVISADRLYEIKGKIGVIGCPPNLVLEDQSMCKPKPIQATQPSIGFEKVGPTKYRVTVGEITGPYYLAFNETFSKGWVLRESIQRLDGKSRKILFNHLVNGWLIEPGIGIQHQTFEVFYQPDVIYQRLIYVSLSACVIILLTIIFLSFRRSFGISERRDSTRKSL